MGNNVNVSEYCKEIPDFSTENDSGSDQVIQVVYINCGSDAQTSNSHNRVTRYGKSFVARYPATSISATRPDFAEFGRSHRWHWNDFGFRVAVPIPGEYDVTLVFCETYSSNFEAGKRMFNVAVEGTTTQEFKDVDVFKEVGANAVYSIALQNVKADDVINIRLSKGAAENPFISGIVVGAVENATPPAARSSIPDPDVIPSKEQCDKFINNARVQTGKFSRAESQTTRLPPGFRFEASGKSFCLVADSISICSCPCSSIRTPDAILASKE